MGDPRGRRSSGFGSARGIGAAEGGCVGSRRDGEAIRKAANEWRVPIVTTMAAARAFALGLRESHESPLGVRSLQEYHAG